MSTLGDMKTEINGIIKRTNYSTYVANAISHAVETMQSERFFFNEVLNATFTCVVGQVYYDGDDDADIPLMNQFDGIHVRISNNDYDLRRIKDVALFENLIDGNVSNGQPHAFLYYGKQIGLYPPPDSTYTVTMMGGYNSAAPASDGETDNVWMTDGYQLVMNEALRWLYKYHIKDYVATEKMEPEVAIQRNRLRSITARLKGSNKIRATEF